MAKPQLIFGCLAIVSGIFASTSSAVLADTLSPKETYLKYRTALAKAKEVKELCPYYCKRTIDQIEHTPEADKPMMFGFMKETSPQVVQVISEDIKDNTASIKLTGKEAGPADPKVKETTEGTVTFIKEGGEWKIDKESWKSTMVNTN